MKDAGDENERNASWQRQFAEYAKAFFSMPSKEKTNIPRSIFVFK